MTGNSRK